MILVLQIVDYLEESILIKKDAYEKLSREHLNKQLKYKFSKYNVDKDFNWYYLLSCIHRLVRGLEVVQSYKGPS